MKLGIVIHSDATSSMVLTRSRKLIFWCKSTHQPITDRDHIVSILDNLMTNTVKYIMDRLIGVECAGFISSNCILISLKVVTIIATDKHVITYEDGQYYYINQSGEFVSPDFRPRSVLRLKTAVLPADCAK